MSYREREYQNYQKSLDDEKPEWCEGCGQMMVYYVRLNENVCENKDCPLKEKEDDTEEN